MTTEKFKVKIYICKYWGKVSDIKYFDDLRSARAYSHRILRKDPSKTAKIFKIKLKEKSMKEKTLNVKSSLDLAAKVQDAEIVGDPDEWILVCKASSQKEGWMKSTKVMHVKNGFLYQISTQQKNPDGSYALAEALAFVPLPKPIRIEDNK